MCSRRKLRSLLMKPAGEPDENDTTFSGFPDTGRIPEDDDSCKVPDSLIEGLAVAHESVMGLSSADNQGFPPGRAGAVGLDQHLYSMDWNITMDSHQWNASAFRSWDAFQPSMWNISHAGFTGGPDRMSLSPDDRTNTPAITPFLAPQLNMATGLLSPLSPPVPTATYANQARPFACILCHDAVSFTLAKDLNRHIRTVHATGYEDAYRCRCGKSGLRKDNHLRHVGKCSKSYPELHYFSCRCGSSYIDKKEYIDHLHSRLNTC
ncbi:hypothetical protein F5Y07DRAFT_402331 [Xylaria sp. FL0933]|nr:hypothetical protein F5Y07DRAFT_402331 [Xylaria sp. FL0933]